MSKKVSIIMGAYNCAPTLHESIESITNQTFTDWEFIICDDGSDDGTWEILQQYAAEYPQKIIVIKNDVSIGLNRTLNRCLEYIQGEYIARQDGDDISDASRLMREVAFLDSHQEYDLVSSHMSFFDEDGVWGIWKTPEKPTREDFLQKSPCFCHAPCMVRKNALINVGGYSVEERYRRCEDINLWYKLYAQGYKGYNIQTPLYSMRDDKNAVKRRTVRNRINIILTEWDGMKSLNCSFWEYRFFLKKAFKNITLCFVPTEIYKILHKRRLNNTKNED